MNAIFSKLNDGGPLIMYTLLFVLLVVLALFIKELVSKKKSQKIFDLIKSLGWFAFAWGFFGQSLGLIGAFDAIQAAGDVSPAILSGGLKIALLGPLFGLFSFLIARIAIIVLIIIRKNN